MTYDLTANFEFRKPTNTNDDDAWGLNLNYDWDLLDTELQDVKDTAEQAASDAADALAALGGEAYLTVDEDSNVIPANSTFNLNVGDDESYHYLIKTTPFIMFVSIGSDLPTQKASRKVIEVLLTGGAAVQLQASTGVGTLICDIGGVGAGNARITAQGRHLIELFSRRFNDSTTVIAKRYGVSTA